MTSTKETTTDEAVLAKAVDGDGSGTKTGAATSTGPEGATNGAEAQARPAPVKRGPGTKEVIPFAWKLIGEANGLALTLFKAIERDDVEAQLVRVANEGYYKKLRILEADARIKQAAAVKSESALFKGTKTVPPPKKGKAKKASAKVEQSTPVIVIASPAKKDAATKAKGKAAKKGAKATKATKKTAKAAKAKKVAKTTKAKKVVKKATAAKATTKSAKSKKAVKKPKAAKKKTPAKAAKKKAKKKK